MGWVYTDTQIEPKPSDVDAGTITFAAFKAALKAELEAKGPKPMEVAISWAINWAAAAPRNIIVGPAKARAAIEKAMSDWHPVVAG